MMKEWRPLPDEMSAVAAEEEEVVVAAMAVEVEAAAAAASNLRPTGPLKVCVFL